MSFSNPGRGGGAATPTMLSLNLDSLELGGTHSASASQLGDPEEEENQQNDQLMTKYSLAEKLADCQGTLRSKERLLRRMRMEQEEQLALLCRQMMSFECGLRRKQKELSVAIQQRDRIIQEQAIVIRFLADKTGNKKRNIADLRSEAMAKIPQVVEETPPGEPGQDNSRNKAPLHLTTIRVNNNSNGTAMSKELTSIIESASENDSDSAIILDDSLASTMSSSSSETISHGLNSAHLRRISRSVSDVMTVSLLSEAAAMAQHQSSSDRLDSLGSKRLSDSSEKSGSGSLSDPEDLQPSSFDSSNYRGFLLRHGSYERYKHRSLRVKKSTEPPSPTNVKSGIHLHHSNPLGNGNTSPGSGNSSVTSSPRQLPSINHRSVTKPRDIKNRSRGNNSSHHGRQQVLHHHNNNSAQNNSRAGAGSSAGVTNGKSDLNNATVAERSGSVYRSSVFLEQDLLQEQSFA